MGQRAAGWRTQCQVSRIPRTKYKPFCEVYKLTRCVCVSQGSTEEMFRCMAASARGAAGGKTAREAKRAAPTQSVRDPPGLPVLIAGHTHLTKTGFLPVSWNINCWSSWKNVYKKNSSVTFRIFSKLLFFESQSIWAAHHWCIVIHRSEQTVCSWNLCSSMKLYFLLMCF